MDVRAMVTRWSERRRARAVRGAARPSSQRRPHAGEAEAWGRSGGPVDPGFGG